MASYENEPQSIEGEEQRKPSWQHTPSDGLRSTPAESHSPSRDTGLTADPASGVPIFSLGNATDVITTTATGANTTDAPAWSFRHVLVVFATFIAMAAESSRSLAVPAAFSSA